VSVMMASPRLVSEPSSFVKSARFCSARKKLGAIALT
jgi:hypothetical protein